MSVLNGRASALAHRNDPVTSHDAAAGLNLSKTTRIKAAILEILAERPRAAFQVQTTYFILRPFNRWPDCQPHSVNRRMSDLHKAGLIRETGRTVPTPDGARAVVWEVVSS